MSNTLKPDPRSPHARLDERILVPGLAVKVSDLVAAFEARYPSDSAAECLTCGHRYTVTSRTCPTLTVVVPLLNRRRHEDPSVVPDWVRIALRGAKSARTPNSRSVDPPGAGELFDSTPYRRPKPSRRTKKPTA
jgi:hypothetical protein